MDHKLMPTALTVLKTLDSLSSGKLPKEIIVLDAKTVSIVVEIEGIDYILSMMEVPRQRAKPATQ